MLADFGTTILEVVLIMVIICIMGAGIGLIVAKRREQRYLALIHDIKPGPPSGHRH